MSTIITRVVDALRAHNNTAEADELLQFVTSLQSNIAQYMGRSDKARELMRIFINTVQSRCTHKEWYLVHTNQESDPGTWGDEDTIACYMCGHTVCDERAGAFGRSYQGRSYLYAVSGTNRFNMSPQMRKYLGDKLKVEEVSRDVYEKALRSACDRSSTS